MDILYGQKTSFVKKKDIGHSWVFVDATGMIAGRLASKVVHRLLGKHRANYTPGFLSGDCVVIINANRVVFTGSKEEQKKYHKHSGYIGGLKTKKLKEISKEKAIFEAINGMLPKTKFGNKLAARLRIFPEDRHNLTAQKPNQIEL